MNMPPQEPSRSTSGPVQNPLLPAGSSPGELSTPAGWTPPANLWLDSPTEDEGMNVAGFLHSLRRRWLPAALVGTVLATIVAGILFFVIPITYESVGYLRVRMSQDELLSTNRYATDTKLYEVFKQTQATLITSPFVLNAALRELETQNLPTINKESNPLGMLQREIQAMYPGKSEILRVSMKGDQKDDVIAIVQEVLEAYLREIAQNERTELFQKLELLRETKHQNVAQLRALSDRIHTLSEEIGTSDSEEAMLQRQFEANQLRSYQAKNNSLRLELDEVQSRLYMMQGLNQSAKLKVNPYDVEMYLEQDRQYAAMKEQMAVLDQQFASVQGTMKPGTQAFAQFAGQRASLEQEMDKRRRELTPRFEHLIRRTVYNVDDNQTKQELQQLQIQAQILASRLKQSDEEVAEQEQRMKDLTGFSADLVSLKAEEESLTESTDEIQKEVKRTELNMEAPPRISLVQPAIIPENNSLWMKILELAAAWLATFLMVVFGIATWDYLSKRMNNSSELEKFVGVPVIGSIPSLRAGVSLLGGGGNREAIVADSVDSLRAAITYGKDGQKIQSVMITSATGQEGKSTVASQLAVSLARSGMRTLLIDGDVRKPQQHAVFGLPADLGLSDVLREESSLEETVQATPAENLWILPAGRCDAVAYRALSGGILTDLMNRLNSQFDFIVVDSGPVLMGPEPLIFGQHVNAAVISTRRDVSQLPKVDEAYRRLQVVGIHVIGAVANGVGAEARPNRLALASS